MACVKQQCIADPAGVQAMLVWQCGLIKSTHMAGETQSKLQRSGASTPWGTATTLSLQGVITRGHYKGYRAVNTGVMRERSQQAARSKAWVKDHFVGEAGGVTGSSKGVPRAAAALQVATALHVVTAPDVQVESRLTGRLLPPLLRTVLLASRHLHHLCHKAKGVARSAG